MKNKLLITLTLAASAVSADPTYITVSGEVSRVIDNTPSKELSHLNANDKVKYVFLIESDEQGFYYSGNKKIIKKDRFSNKNIFSDFMYSDYICGTAINEGYYSYKYNLAESTKSYSSERTLITTGARIDAAFHELLPNLYLGLRGKAINHYRPQSAKHQKSWIESQVEITDISSINPCS